MRNFIKKFQRPRYVFERYFATKKIEKIIEDSGLFDKDWYLKRYVDLAKNHKDPIQHYILKGAFQGFFPNPIFDSAYYLENNLDVKRSGINPLVHFIKRGAKEKREPHPLFSLIHYCAVNKKLENMEVNPLRYFLEYGSEDLSDPHPLFINHYYKEKYLKNHSVKIAPLLHFLINDDAKNNSPHPLFDPNYYLRKYPDIAQANINPYIHFLKYGWKEGRNPSALFDTHFYKTVYADKLGINENPLLHFWLNCNQQLLSPNPYFDTKSYLKKNQDIKNAGLNPLLHYLEHGCLEGRKPSYLFDPKFYLSSYSDVKESGVEPLSHFLEYGIFQGRKASDIIGIDLLKHKNCLQKKKCKITANKQIREFVSVVVPIYRDVKTTKECVDSVLAAKSNIPYKLILINDCSPEKEMYQYLSSLEKRVELEVLTNEVNLGFVGTVNRGMSLYPNTDVILLNSDTLVADHWIDRIFLHLNNKIGTITPFSNNATICNYPDIEGFSDFKEGESLALFNQAFFLANEGESVEIPTAVGYCMFISRECLNEVGLFDKETFGKGYGEENDFCLRASALGWKHLLAGDVFVYHKGEVSFAADSSPGKKAATKILREKYPFYDSLIIKHLEENPALSLRLKATAEIYKAKNKPVVLLVSHSLGGGTEKHIEDIRKRNASKYSYIMLRPAEMPVEEGDFVLEFENHQKKMQFIGNKELSLSFARDFLKLFSISEVQVHHVLGFGFSVEELLKSLNLSYQLSVHDYFMICPQITLTNEEGDYCRELGEESCNICISKRATWGARDIVSWRDKYRGLILNSNKIVCPSKDVQNRMKRYIPSPNYSVVPHEEIKSSFTYYLKKISQAEKFKIAVIGAIWPHKGASLILEVAKKIKRENLPYEITIIGYYYKGLEEEAAKYMSITGEFSDENLRQILQATDPDLIWFPARCPETYSFTLSAAINFGRPILSADIGALSERLEGREWTWLHKWDISAVDVLDQFAKIKNSFN